MQKQLVEKIVAGYQEPISKRRCDECWLSTEVVNDCGRSFEEGRQSIGKTNRILPTNHCRKREKAALWFDDLLSDRK